MKSKDILKIGIGILISITLLVAVFWFADPKEVARILKQGNYWLIIPAALVYILSMGLRTQAWRILLKYKAPYKHTYLTIQSSYLLNNILPFRLGEFGRIFFMRRYVASFWQVFSTLVIERVIDVLIALSLFFIALPFAAKSMGTESTMRIILVVVAVGIIVLVLFLKYIDGIINFISSRKISTKPLVQFILRQIRAFRNAFAEQTNPRILLQVSLLLVIHWCVAMVTQYILMRAYIGDVPLLAVVFGQGVSGLGIAIPSSPGYIGVYQATWVGALTMFGIESDAALAFSIVSHLLYLVTTSLFGVILIYKEGISLGRIFEKIKSIRGVASSDSPDLETEET